jgi:hypothetical protein
MSERVTEAELSHQERECRFPLTVQPKAALRLIAEVRRLRALIVASVADRCACHDCVTRLADGLDALDVEARAIRGER